MKRNGSQRRKPVNPHVLTDRQVIVVARMLAAQQGRAVLSVEEEGIADAFIVESRRLRDAEDA